MLIKPFYLLKYSLIRHFKRIIIDIVYAADIGLFIGICNLIDVLCICSHLPVKGMYVWCQGCSHGGHLQHMKQWLAKNSQCPAGCGHLCELT